MGFAHVTIPDLTVRPSPIIKDGFYCGRCEAHYTPNLVWGYNATPRGDTSGVQRLRGCRQLGDECPFCGQHPTQQNQPT